MAPSLIYRYSWIYELIMMLLYRRQYGVRRQVIADILTDGSSVLDLCCGPALFYKRFMKPRGIRYTGVDINSRFIVELKAVGAGGEVIDLRQDCNLPPLDYVIMHASLYHFLPDSDRIFRKMLKAANEYVIISEPIRNLASRDSKLLRFIVAHMTNPGYGQQADRFDEESLDRFFSSYQDRLVDSFIAAGGREKVYVFQARYFPAELPEAV